MGKIVNVYVVRDTSTGLYEEGEGHWSGKTGERVWVPRCTAESLDDAAEYDDEDLAEQYPAGLPAGWEAIKVSSFEARERG